MRPVRTILSRLLASDMDVSTISGLGGVALLMLSREGGVVRRVGIGALAALSLLIAAGEAHAEPKRDLVWFFKTVCFDTIADRRAALAVATGLGFVPGQPLMIPSGQRLPDGTLEKVSTENWRLSENNDEYLVVFDQPQLALNGAGSPEENVCMVSMVGDGAAFFEPLAVLAGVERDSLLSSSLSWIRTDFYRLPHPADGQRTPTSERPQALDGVLLSISTVTVKGNVTTAVVVIVPKEPAAP